MDSSSNTNAVEGNKIVNYTLPTTLSASAESSRNNNNNNRRNNSSDASSALTAAGREQRLTPALTVFTSAASTPTSSHSSPFAMSTPTKEFPNAQMLRTIREKLMRTPGGVCELHALSFAEQTNLHGSMNAFGVGGEQPVKVIKNRYLISAQPSHISAAAAAKTPASYRHLIDLTSSNLQCVDVFTGEQFLCKIINEPLHKVQRAYFQLEQDEQLCRSTIYGHTLIRGVHDLVPLSKNRTYIIIAPVQQTQQRVYENLHTYIRHEKRLCEPEARAIFHQICQTVQVCHRNGIILRDLKLKRFYFIDEARTKLQYESLEGSMILDGDDDTLSDKIGCPLYTAPELLCPQPTYQGKPADMWSLGVILYTMLVGQYPFYEKANCNLITVIRHGNVQIPMSLSKSVRWLMLSLLRKNYTERMTATHIFLTPWLKEQRPFHLYLPVNVEIADDWDVDVDQDEHERMEEGDMSDLCQLGDKREHEYEDIGVEPLDYTHSTLQMAQTSVSSSLPAETDADADEDMG
ncbi:tribbles [Drosophila montana]|uniref:tribbles n=1 Tax=Drosophila montana TaxID=40370 RepID=UPI00313E3E83